MNNFFHHLLQRSFAPTPSIQPRLASLFEPSVAPLRGPAAPGEVHAETIAPTAPPTLAPLLPASRPPAAASAALLTPLPAATILSASVPAIVSAPAWVPASSLPSVQPAASAPTPADSSASRAQTRAASAKATREPLNLLQPTTHPLLIERVAPRPSDGLVVAQPSAPDAAPVSLARAPSTIVPARLAPLDAPREAASPPPGIRVTIGRIDIRAVQEPAAVGLARPAAPGRRPVLSLEDYLKQRAAS
jgi:hypothetical protein